MLGFIVAIVFVLVLASFPLFFFLTEYKPDEIEEAIKYRNNREIEPKNTYTITTFNIGFCGLDRAQDFFLDGGHGAGVKTREERFDNLLAITSIIESLNSDFYIFQEIDTHGSRTSDINQVEHIASEMPNHNLFFAYNIKSKWIPFPLMHPMGSVYSGILTMSKIPFSNSERIAMKGELPLPNRFFLPKRCMQVSTFQLKGKTLYIINVHLSAYDKQSSLRFMQFQQVMDYAEKLYNPKQNHIIIGGDFNMDFDPNIVYEHHPSWYSKMPYETIPKSFLTAYDTEVNTMRSNNQPYIKTVNFEAVIDGFIVSDNLKIIDVKNHDYEFEHSDHNPVTLTFQSKR
jgi:endonuclease/exonuclease/phosphatase family metal-dependent hydrolase